MGGPGVLAAFFASIVLILLVSSEFTWRTSRQNVIDGLSKEEFFGAKLFLLPGVGLFFFIVMVLVAGGFAFAGTVAKGVLGSTGALVRQPTSPSWGLDHRPARLGLAGPSSSPSPYDRQARRSGRSSSTSSSSRSSASWRGRSAPRRGAVPLRA
ncbi:MAG: hypothetical protein IPP20_20760 [Gemmatimonadetes bacterium]|nr:hypothetical protein [Gemmatimonadota bacterium]